MQKIILLFFFTLNLFAKRVELDLQAISITNPKKHAISRSDLYCASYKEIGDIFRLKSVVASDVIFCQKKMKGAGFCNGKVIHSIKEYPDKYLVQIIINYGQRYKIKEIRLRDIYDKKILVPAEKVMGKSLNFEKLNDLEEKIYEYYGNLGYPFVKVIKKKVYLYHKDRNTTIDFIIDLEERANFGEIVLKGNKDVNGEFILKQVPWKAGDKYDRKLLEKLKQNLLSFNLFNQVVIKVFKDVNGDAGVLIHLSEAKSKLVELGVKYSTSNNTFYSKKIRRKISGLMTTLSWSNFNLLGNGEILRLHLEGTPFYSKGSIKNSVYFTDEEKKNADKNDHGEENDKTLKKIEPDFLISLSFKKPKYDGKKDLSFTAVYYNNWNIKYVKRSKEIEVSLGRTVNERFFHMLSASTETYKIREFSAENGKVKDESKNHSFFALRYNVAWNLFDNVTHPESGNMLEGFVSPKFGRKSFFAQLHIKYMHIFNLDKIIFTAWGSYDRLLVGYGKENIPADKLLYSGGANSVRAYAKNYACVFDKGFPKGGKFLIEAGIEVAKPISRKWSVVTFLEGSKVCQTGLARKNKIFLGYGIGARYFTSFSPVNIDIAFPTKRRKGIDSAFQILISIGKNL